MKPKIIDPKNHTITIDDIDSDALLVLDKLHAKGHTAYLVGGCIRDLLLGHKPKDFDISTSAKPEEIKKIFKNCLLIGRRFRLAHIRFGKKIIEVSTFRKGEKDSDNLIVEDNLWGNEEEDVIRRDFTINGLFYDSQTECIIDYVKGFQDIKKHLLHTIGDPNKRFKQDPVRMIRCVKFKARFGFEIDIKTLEALSEAKGEILKSSQARIFEELLRMLESGASKKFFQLMSQYGLLDPLMPNFAKFLALKIGSTTFDYLDELDLMVKEIPSRSPHRSFTLSCLVYPLLANHLKKVQSSYETALHLGQIQKETSYILDTVFRPFFHLSKKIRTDMQTILSSQFRITPLDGDYKARIRVPRITNFHLALDFLSLRARLDTSLLEIQKVWNYYYQKRKLQPAAKRKYRRPRRT